MESSVAVQIILAVVGILTATIGGLLVLVAGRVAGDLQRLTTSVEALNINFARILERQEGLEKRVGLHGKRIDSLEKKVVK